MRESGTLDKILQDFAVSREPKNQPSTIDVSMVTVAPILVVLAAGYVIGIFVWFIEGCAHGIKLKYWRRGRVRRRRENEYWRVI